MKQFAFLAACTCLVAACPGPIRAAADPAGAYISIKGSIRQGVLPQQSLNNILLSPAAYKGRAVEVTADVLGAISSGASRSVLCNVGGTSMTLTLPPSLANQDWIEAGHALRILLSVDSPSGQDPGAMFKVISAAPEYDVAQEESAVPTGWTRVISASRSLAYVRTPVASQPTPVAGVGAPDTSYLDPGHPIASLTPGAQAVYPIYRNQISELNSRLTDAQLDKITTSILYFSQLNDIDPRLMMAMIIAESGFDVNSTSRTGARGLGQLMPETARGLSVTDPYDIIQNIGASAHILRGRLDQYGGAPAAAGEIPSSQLKLVMAAYNAGPGAVAKYHGVPPYRETQRYVVKVDTLYRTMCGDR
jgi:hypothetical protein